MNHNINGRTLEDRHNHERNTKDAGDWEQGTIRESAGSLVTRLRKLLLCRDWQRAIQR